MTNEVFVLGAGFSRALVPQSPLLVDDYGIKELQSRFSRFPHARAILDDAYREFGNGRVDLERLMTRLSGMPYDAIDARRECGLVETGLRQTLVAKLRTAKAAHVNWERLRLFAHRVLSSESSIVTFNYDDVVDEALWRAAIELSRDDPIWHPDGGYGFYCRPSSVCVTDTMRYMNETPSLLLKLHGSINWRSRLGESLLRGPGGVLHHQDWTPSIQEIEDQTGAPISRIESHLEPEPFIVPPVLAKTELSTHPVLSIIWKLAYEKLASANSVTFIGYSLPKTDLASRTLFREALGNRPNLKMSVIDYAAGDGDHARVREAYRSLFEDLRDDAFDFSGASAFVDRNCGLLVVDALIARLRDQTAS
jgi:hypothetical protein